MKVLIALTVVIIGCLAQRSPFAGKNPIGYPIITVDTESDQLENRFGDGDDSTTTMKLPIEALGDAELVRRLSKLPQDRQPFWLLNWQALEANRNNPQSFPQRGNSFINNKQN